MYRIPHTQNSSELELLKRMFVSRILYQEVFYWNISIPIKDLLAIGIYLGQYLHTASSGSLDSLATTQHGLAYG